MNIISHFKHGATRSVKLWKWILVIWITDLLVVSFLALTIRGEMNSVFGKSLITERLAEGSIVDAIANTGTGLQVLVSSFRTGFFLVTFFGLIINVFLTGGLFALLRYNEGKTGSPAFFSGASVNFWSFILIWILIALMITLVSFLLIGLPVIAKLTSSSGGSSGLLKITSLVFLIILPVFLLVADYSRAWQASNEKKNAFRAVGMGFKNTFRHFFSSWVVMFILIIIQLIYTLIVFRITGGFKPVSSGGIFLLFILIQLLFILKAFLQDVEIWLCYIAV